MTIVFLILAYAALADIQFSEILDISLTNILTAEKEYVTGILLNHQSSLAFASVSNSTGQRNRIITIKLEPTVEVSIKKLSKSISRLELITLDDKYIVTKHLEYIPINELINPSINTINVIEYYGTELIKNITCIRHSYKNSQLIALTRTGDVYLISNESFHIASKEFIPNCGTLASIYNDLTIYGMARNSKNEIKIVKYMNDVVNIKSENMNASIELLDFMQQMYISPLGNYMVYLNTEQILLYALNRNYFSIRLIGTFNISFTTLDFLSDNIFFGYELFEGNIVVMEFNSLGEFTVLCKYKLSPYFNIEFGHALNSQVIALSNFEQIKLFRILPINKNRSGEWSYFVFAFGIIMSIIMIMLAAYFLRDKELSHEDLTSEGHNHESFSTENITANSGQSIQLLKNVLTCPLTNTIMNSPTTISDGNTYEKLVIQDWVDKNEVSPLTGERLRNKDLVKNIVLEKIIEVAKIILGNRSTET